MLTLIILCSIGVGNAWGAEETVTYTITSTTAVSTDGTAPAGSSASYSQTYSTAGQATKGNTMTLTLTGFDGCTITGLSCEVGCYTGWFGYVSGKGTISISINGDKKGSSSLDHPAAHSVETVSVLRTTVAEDGTIVITISATESSLYCYSYKITYTPPCTPLGTINGPVSLSTDGCGAGELKATWKMLATTGIASQILKVYDENSNEVTAKRVTGLTASTSTQTVTISGLNPCKEYHVTVENVSSGGEYCAAGEPWVSTVETTPGYTYTINKTNVSLKAGETEAANSCDDFYAIYVADAGYDLPATITVTNAGAEGTGWLWDVSDGSLMIDNAYVTGNVTVKITGTQSNYTITYDKGANGTGSISAGNKTHGVDFTLSSETFTRTGYTQDGWSTSDGGDKVYNLGGSYSDNAAITLYPHWEINKYTVSWSVNGSSWSNGVTDANNKADYNTTVSAPTAPTSSDCDGSKVFVGWTNAEYSDPSSAPTTLFTGTSPAITANTTFYAVFATESGGGELVSISGGEMASSLPSGWSAKGTDGFYSGNGVKYNSERDYIISGDISSHGLTSVTVKFKAGYNGSEGSVLRIEAIDENGYEIGGVDFVPTETYNAQSTINSVVVSASGTIYYIAVEMTSRTSNVGVKYCEVFKGGTSYSDYSTSCGNCLAAPSPITVNAKSTSATLSWPAVSGATGYTVTCKQGGVDQGSVSVVGTTATITGLTAENTYQYTVQSVTTDPSYVCFPTKKGTFTTSNCDDVPVISSVVATTTTITFNWTCTSNNSTIYIISVH